MNLVEKEMTICEAIEARHSVRSYKNMPIPKGLVKELQNEIELINGEKDMHIQLCINEPGAFSGLRAHYGNFKGVENYIAVVGKKSGSLDERLGYYGEGLVLKAQILGLNTCWVGQTYNKNKCHALVAKGEKIPCVIAIGYGETQGVPHKSKPMETRYKAENPPEWFIKGMEAVMLAPTAINQQKFIFELKGDAVSAKATGKIYANLDLGIAKYHFEVGAGKENFIWE